ncbi:MAG: exonuclease domain-containing protein [Candidatus Cloacimonetes bacterium]|nr:exonuclease domain-containing protein [Candidatus Cloacimonadota bacterium]
MTEKDYKFPFVVVDIETTGLSYHEAEIIEIGAIRFHADGSRDSFSSFIKPQKPVPLFIYTLTKIKEDDLRHADKANKVLQDFSDFLTDEDILVCHNVEFDISFLNHHLAKHRLEKLYHPVIDTLVVSHIFFPFLKSHALGAIANYFEINFLNAHRAICDAEVTGIAFSKMTDFIVDKIKPEHLNFIIIVLEYCAKADQGKNKFLKVEKESYLLQYLQGLQKHIIKYALTKPYSGENPYVFEHFNFIERKNGQTSATDPYTIQNIFCENGYFSKTFEKYELRSGQIEMAEAVLHAFENEEYLLVEAGTGVGKSLAYIIPALLFSLKNGKKIVISTNTKNLQEQLLFKDIPLVLKAVDLDLTAVLVKGRENYLCLRKWQEIYEAFQLRQANITMSPQEAMGVTYLYFWINHTQTGDVNENYGFQTSRYSHIWKRISSDRHLCLGRKCRHHSRCFLANVRAKAETANLIVINHSLLFSDFQAEKPTLGEIDYLIFDEGHNLLNSAANYLGFSLSFSDVQGFLNTIYCLRNGYQSGMLPNLKNSAMRSSIPEKEKESLVTLLDDLANFMDDAKDTTEKAFRTAGEVAKTKGNYNKYRIKDQSTLLDLALLIAQITDIRSYLEKLAAQLKQIHGAVLTHEAKNFADQDIILDFLERTSDRLGALIRDADKLIEPDLDKYAYWLSALDMQTEGYPAGVLNYAPITVDDLMPDIFYRRIKSMVVTSATISLRGSFKYFKEHLGFAKLIAPPQDTATPPPSESTENGSLIKKLQEKIVPSPFDYDQQTLVLNASYLPANTDPYFFPQSDALIKGILESNKAGTLILFTSYSDMHKVHESLEKSCFESDTLLLMQRGSSNRSSILQQFIENGSAVLLGTSSFWEGVDVQGESLSLLIMYKLPFQVPTEPIVEAYLEKLEKEGKQSFLHYSLPNALLKMRQGIGRLIRSKTDKGVILILDNRIYQKTYGKYFQEITPTKIQKMNNHTETITAITKKLEIRN